MAVVPANVQYYEELAGEYPLFFRDLESNMEEEGEWLDRVLHRHGARSVLDASCGSGRQAIPLARRGYRVTAVDPCGAMLAEARRRTAGMGTEIQFHQAGFTDLPSVVHRRFDAVIALGNGLCHQERREEIVSSLRAMRSCCRAGGVCLIGIKDFDRIVQERQPFHPYQAQERDGDRTILFQVWRFEDPILVCVAVCLSSRGGEWSARCAQTREYMLGAEDLRAAIREAGFSSIQRLGHPSEAVYLLA